MSIQSSLNSMLTTAGYVGGMMNAIGQLKKQTKLQEGWFGDKPTPDKSIRDMLDADDDYSNESVQEAKDNITQREYEASGQAGQDMEDMAAYEEQAREKAIINYTRDTRIQTKQNHKEKRKEYSKKPRKLNKHGVLYEEVMK